MDVFEYIERLLVCVTIADNAKPNCTVSTFTLYHIGLASRSLCLSLALRLCLCLFTRYTPITFVVIETGTQERRNRCRSICLNSQQYHTKQYLNNDKHARESCHVNNFTKSSNPYLPPLTTTTTTTFPV